MNERAIKVAKTANQEIQADDHQLNESVNDQAPLNESEIIQLRLSDNNQERHNIETVIINEIAPLNDANESS